MNPSIIPSASKIDQALLDVRKAYRLLHDYQRIVLDAVNYIGKQFGLSYRGGIPYFSNVSPREEKGKLDNCAWDWLNMVFYEFYFRSEGEDDKTSLRFSVILISDSGWFCAEDEYLVKSNVAHYLAPELSSTKVGFIVSGPQNVAFSFTESKEAMKTFIVNSGELPAEYAAKGIYGKCFDMGRLASEEETNRLLDELVLFAQANGIQLKRVAAKA